MNASLGVCGNGTPVLPFGGVTRASCTKAALIVY
jgi:hypothetical protein